MSTGLAVKRLNLLSCRKWGENVFFQHLQPDILVNLPAHLKNTLLGSVNYQKKN